MPYEQLLRPDTVMFLVLGLVAIVYFTTAAASHVLTHREEVRLKTRLVERGFSAEEIERVVRAGGTYSHDE
jgi:hypothetical protein